jgi:hypothetical protein
LLVNLAQDLLPNQPLPRPKKQAFIRHGPDESDIFFWGRAISVRLDGRRDHLMIYDQYVGIDYSGAQTPTSSLKGLRVYTADHLAQPTEVRPPPSPRKYWTRYGVAEWLVQTLSEETQTIVGIDHAFSFPLRYFDRHRLAHDWSSFLDDYQKHWPTDGDHAYVDFVRDGLRGHGSARTGNSRWRRLTELRAGTAKSVFHFDVPGSVAKSTHAGLPWLRYLRQTLGNRVQFWPFDGWAVQPGRSAIVEVYPSLWSRRFERNDRTADQHDAYSVCAWMQLADRDGTLASLFEPSFAPADRAVAEIEGWILGVP